MSPMRTPEELADAFARLSQAAEDYNSFVGEIDRFFYDYFAGMKTGPDEGGAFVQLRPPLDSVMQGRPQVLVAQIVEHLRAALDRMVFALSAQENQQLNEKVPQFVIAETPEDFRSQARRLRYLTTEQRGFIEDLQPYQEGRGILRVLADMVNASKHRRLVWAADCSGCEVIFAERSTRDQYQGYFEFPIGGTNSSLFVKREGRRAVTLGDRNSDDRYDALALLSGMIEAVSTILGSSVRFFPSADG